MDAQALRLLLSNVRRGKTTVDAAARAIAALPARDLGYATVDGHRAIRQGVAEVVYAAGKTPDQVAGIVTELSRLGQGVLVTRLEAANVGPVQAACPEGRYEPIAKIFVRRRGKTPAMRGPVGIVCAGTSDIPVTEEAAIMAEFWGAHVKRIYDVGVAGLHRVLAKREAMAECAAIVVCAGMEGALPTVVGGLLARPVIAVPTSVGYGASLGGIAALLGMLNSCASNVAVVNIDNGFGAGFYAALIARK